MKFAYILALAGICAAQTFCRCEDQRDLSYYLFTVTDEIKQELSDRYPDSRVSSDCSYCSKLTCQYLLEKNDSGNLKLHEISVNCFKRESARDKFIIYGFILLAVGLVVYGTLFKKGV